MENSHNILWNYASSFFSERKTFYFNSFNWGANRQRFKSNRIEQIIQLEFQQQIYIVNQSSN